MHIAVAIYMFVHGFAHIVGFLVSWKLVNDKDTPYKTTILGGKLDLGHMGIRVMGVLWLIIGFAFFLMTYGAFIQSDWWKDATYMVAYVSLIMSLLDLPDTKYGVIANVLLILFLWVTPFLGWMN